MPTRLIDKLFARTDPNYAQALARQDELDQYLENAIIPLTTYVQKYDRFTVTPLEENVKPHGWITCGALYALNRTVEYVPGYIDDGNLYIPQATSPLGLLVALSKSFSDEELKIVRRFYEENKGNLGIDCILYMSSSPVRAESVNCSVSYPERKQQKPGVS